MELSSTTSVPAETVEPKATSDQIKAVNDHLRKHVFVIRKVSKSEFSGLTRDIGLRLFLTQAIKSLPSSRQVEIIDLVRNFDDFTEGDNPYGENDFGGFTYRNTNYFFKFDYYDCSYHFGETNGNRVLTIMEASEY